MLSLIPFVAALAAAFTTVQQDSTLPDVSPSPTSRAITTAGLPQPVTGTVQDTAGRPLSDAQVIIPALNRVTTTNEAGSFTFTALPAGTYHIVTILIGYATGHGDVTVTESAAPATVTIVMRSASAVTQLSAVQVTATPIGTDPRDVAQSTTEISGSALARGLSGSVAQSLSREPGISVRNSGPGSSAPVIRGLSGERVLVLQDGERTGDLASASPDHAVSIDPLIAQRIEVVRGPASLLYGNNALGGVVNVISNDLPTTIPTHVDGYLSAQSESATPGGGAAFGITLPLSSTVAIVGRAQGRSTDDLRVGGGAKLPNSYNKTFSGAGGIGFATGTNSGGLLFRGNRFDYGLPSADNDNVHIEGSRNEVNGRLELGGSLGFFTSMRLGSTAQWYEHDEIEGSGEVGTSFDLKTQTLDLLGRTRVGPVAGAVGATGLFRQYQATGEEAVTPGADTKSGGVFLYQEIPLWSGVDPESRIPRIQVGARYDYYSIESKSGEEKFGPATSRNFNNFSGSLGLSYPVTQDVTVAASAARAFRAPTVEELFSNGVHHAAGTYDIGNPDLVSEINQGFDAIVRAQSTRVTGQLSAYYNKVGNFISPNIIGDTLIEHEGELESVPVNRFRQADATLRGIEGRLEGEVYPRLVLGIVGDVVRGKFNDDEPLPFMPAARLGGLARFEGGRVSLDADYRHAFAQDRVPEPVGEEDPAAVATEAYDLVNLSGTYSFALRGLTHAITLRVDNLFDEQYRDAASRLKAFAFGSGRNISLGYRLLF
jgi:iron complex outermembrane receptor protein